MGQQTAISWANATWNPWQGCHKVSAGCANCYMYREKTRYGQAPDVVVRSASKTFHAPLTWARNGKIAPGSHVFVCSWSDFFVSEADPWRAEAWDIIRNTPMFTYLILTKRIELTKEHLPADWGAGYPNVWLGVTVENEPQRWRALKLLTLPARLRFVSIEPMLGKINLSGYLLESVRTLSLSGYFIPTHGIDWVIVGGESGPGCRKMEIDWALDMRRQCWEMGVPFFFKQMGGWPDKRARPEEWPADLRVQEFPFPRKYHPYRHASAISSQ